MILLKEYYGGKLTNKRKNISTFDEINKEARRFFKFPITKELLYYPNPYISNSFYHISKYSAIKKYNISEPWYEIVIELENGSKVIINSMYLQEMQTSSFLSDYRSMPIEESII